MIKSETEYLPKMGYQKLQDLIAFSALRVFTDHLRPLEEGDGKVIVKPH